MSKNSNQTSVTEKLEKEVVAGTARLARLAVSESDLNTLQEELGEILAYAARLSEVDTDSTEPTFYSQTEKNVFREDINRESLDFDSFSKNSPDVSGGSFRVPKVIG